MRISRWIKAHSAHGHCIAAHNGPTLPPFAQRFAADPKAVDAIMFQEWGTRDKENGWLAAGIEESIDASLEGRQGSAVLAEWGYERNPELELKLPSHLYCDEEHTRRGAWRGVFRGLGIIHGFENSWGPWQALDRDQPGLEALLHLHHFMTTMIPFHQMRPAPDIVETADSEIGHRPQALATPDLGVMAVYLPVGGQVSLPVLNGDDREDQWFDPRTGSLFLAEGRGDGNRRVFSAPQSDQDGHPCDWILLARTVPAL